MRRRSGGTCCLSAAAKSLDFDPRCHPEEAESHAKRETPDEGPMQLAGILIPACAATLTTP
jgi:hypothetical protein